MEKPKIVSMKDALDLAETESEIPELPGAPKTEALLPPPALPEAPLGLSDSSTPPSLESEHPPEVPPERIPQSPPSSMAPLAPALPPAETPQPPAPEPVLAPEPVQPLAGSPPWVERQEQEPTVSEIAGPVPTYPGVGRPRINSISQGTISVEPPKPVTAPIRPASAVAAPSAKLYERPELDADRFAEEMASTTPVQRDVVKEYRDAASRDMLPPAAPPRPLTAEEERARARSLAQQIHQENQKSGFFGKVRRMFGMR